MQGSVGKTKTRYAVLDRPIVTENGSVLSGVTVAYETYGTLNDERSNAVLICHALTGDAHAAGFHENAASPGWWDIVIGPGKAIDTNRYFVICSNVLGGCMGTTGPASIDPATGKPYGLTFPVVTIGDMVRVQKELIDHLGLPHLFAVIGGSMGGMQALQWAISYPGFAGRIAVIASTAYSTPQQIAFNEIGRFAVKSDPAWNKGNYYDKEPPRMGLALARMIGHVTYLSDESMSKKFGRLLQDKETYSYDFTTDFAVESYLHYQGDKFTQRFDANAYLYVTKAVDYFNPADKESLAETLKKCDARFLIVSVSSDWLYPPYLSREITTALLTAEKDVEYEEIRSNFGHDAFLLESGQMNYILGRFLSTYTVSDLMKTDIPTVFENTPVEEAATLMIEEFVDHLPVVTAEGKLAGIVTTWDIARSVAQGYRELKQIMTVNVHTTMPDESVREALRKMEKYHISALPVVDSRKKLMGIVNYEDLKMTET